jgi:predicted DNA-binding transcriptional regulator AlpA
VTHEQQLDAIVGDLRAVVEDLRSELADLRCAGTHADVTPDARSALLSPSDVAQVLGVSDRTLRRLRKHRRFPKPLRGTGRRPKWTYASIARYTEGAG